MILNDRFVLKGTYHYTICHFAIIGLLFCVHNLGMAQVKDSTTIKIAPTPNGNVEELVLEEFIKKGNCVEVFNVQPIGDVKSIGSFSNGKAAIGIDEGIVFTSGDLEDIEGPNLGPGATGGHYGQSDAPYLSEVLRGVPFFDVIGIEFDFTPTSDFVSFSYVFASEEYCEYVGSQFNDAFGFFVSGPGIDGDGFNNSINVAKIEQKNDAVTINNVNHLKNSSFFVNNLTRTDLAQCGIQEGPKNLNAIEFDGFTTKLQAFFSVIPCETYHIRLVVGDVSDDILDSAVFLEGKSFDTGAKATIRTLVNNQPDSIIYENCLEGTFVIDRSKLSDRNKPLEVDVSFLGTATNGVDFEAIPNQITLETRELRRDFPIQIIPDELIEGQEYVDVIVKTTTCDCEELDTTRLYINDSKETLTVNFDEENVCPRQPFNLSPNVPDGIEPLFFEWSNGDTLPIISDEITEPKLYAVTVTDACGATNNDVVEVQIQPVPTLAIDGAFTWCEGRNPETLLIEFPGQAPWSLDYSIDNQIVEQLEGITQNPFPFPFNNVGSYEFEGFNDKHCNGIVQGNVEVSDISFAIEEKVIAPSCLNASDGSIELSFDGGMSPFRILWDTLNENSTIIKNISAGNYNVRVTDGLGCLIEKSISLPDASPFANCNLDFEKTLYVPNAFSPNGDGINDTFTVFPKFGLIKSISYTIFDRWGSKIFQSPPYDSIANAVQWDGGEQQAGVYFCIIEVRLSNDSKDYYGTDVTLVY